MLSDERWLVAHRHGDDHHLQDKRRVTSRQPQSYLTSVISADYDPTRQYEMLRQTACILKGVVVMAWGPELCGRDSWFQTFKSQY